MDIKKILNHIINVIEDINGLLLFLLSITLFFAVLARYVFQIPIPESTIIQKFSVSWMVFLGSAIAIKEKQHLEIDIFTEYLSPKLLQVKEICAYILTFVAINILVFVGFNSFMAGLIRTELIPIRFITKRISLIYFNSSIIVGSIFMLVFHLYNLKDYLPLKNNNKK